MLLIIATGVTATVITISCNFSFFTVHQYATLHYRLPKLFPESSNLATKLWHTAFVDCRCRAATEKNKFLRLTACMLLPNLMPIRFFNDLDGKGQITLQLFFMHLLAPAVGFTPLPFPSFCYCFLAIPCLACNLRGLSWQAFRLQPPLLLLPVPLDRL